MPVYLPEKYKKQLPADIGNEETEKVLAEMIAEIESVYGQAYTELKAKADNYLAWFVAEDAAQRERLKNGDISVKEYQNWRERKLLTGQHWFAMSETMAQNLANSNGIAMSIISDYIPEVYAINGNWTTYQIEHQLKINTSFELYDHQTIERLIRDHPDLLPQPKVNIPLDMRWNTQNLQSAVMQSILQGESVDQLADRLAGVSDMNKTSAIRNAKTMTTSAQNGGRQAAMERAETLGIKGKKMWVSTLDHHTRASHIDLDGEIVGIHDKFSNGLMFPGEAGGEPAEIYNCRCREVEVFDDQDIHNAERASRLDNHLGEMTYDEWKESHREGKQFRAAANVNRDYSMMREYRQLLGSKVPTNIKEFQKIKYNEPDKWKQWISEARKARAERRRQNGG